MAIVDEALQGRQTSIVWDIQYADCLYLNRQVAMPLPAAYYKHCQYGKSIG
ncbi:MAG: hypothetical protein IPH02_00005 [Sphingobacteriales bacterium]|nr:hypothetical protein [Sphingobacteriales bacterium]